MTAAPSGTTWPGFPAARHLYEKRRFVGVALDPPDMQPGSWTGAGKTVVDPDTGTFLVTARPRRATGNVRGYEAQIYSSADGLRLQRLGGLTKEEVCELSGVAVHSIEGTQLLCDPATGRWHFYLSVDTGADFAWGGVEWQTMLFTADQVTGPWQCHGIVVANGGDADRLQARDSTIDLVDGEWLCLYKAKNAQKEERPSLATSPDGLAFRKRGTLTVDGEDRICFLSGTLFPAPNGVCFVGVETIPEDSLARQDDEVYADHHMVGHGGGPPASFVSMRLDVAAMDLETTFRAPWVPLSEHENPDHPLLGYSSLVADPAGTRMLIHVEAIDPRLSTAIGLNTTVERLLLYEAPLA